MGDAQGRAHRRAFASARRNGGTLQFGDKLPLANVSCWITEVIEGTWTDGAGESYDGRAKAVAGPASDELIEGGSIGP